MNAQELKAFNFPVDGNVEAQMNRGLKFAIGSSIVRKIGWASDSSPKCQVATKDDLERAKVLKEIERFAGFILVKRSDECPICNRNRMMFTQISQRDYIFSALPNGYTYRWEYSLMHYLEGHKIKSPIWLPELVEDFKKAQEQGLWRSAKRVLAA